MYQASAVNSNPLTSNGKNSGILEASEAASSSGKISEMVQQQYEQIVKGINNQVAMSPVKPDLHKNGTLSKSIRQQSGKLHEHHLGAAALIVCTKGHQKPKLQQIVEERKDEEAADVDPVRSQEPEVVLQ